MPKMDGTGPDCNGAKTGRKLGNCSDLPLNELETKLGNGLGRKRHSAGGQGKGKRLKYNQK